MGFAGDAPLGGPKAAQEDFNREVNRSNDRELSDKEKKELDARRKEEARAKNSKDPLERLFGGRLPGENRKNYLLRGGRSLDTLNKQNDWLKNVDINEEATHDQLQDYISANKLLVYYDEIGVINKKNKTTNKWINRITKGKNAMNQLRTRNAPVQKEKSRQFLHNRGIKGRTILSGQPTSQTNRPRVAQPQINSATTGTTLIRTG
jgi:hypothetical protein